MTSVYRFVFAGFNNGGITSATNPEDINTSMNIRLHQLCINYKYEASGEITTQLPMDNPLSKLGLKLIDQRPCEF